MREFGRELTNDNSVQTSMCNNKVDQKQQMASVAIQSSGRIGQLETEKTMQISVPKKASSSMQAPFKLIDSETKESKDEHPLAKKSSKFNLQKVLIDNEQETVN